MLFKQQATPEISVGEAPSKDDLAAIAREGYKTVLDLRPLDEEPHAPDRLRGSEERQAAGALGLRYENVPVRIDQVDEALIGRVGERIRAAEKPVLVHCARGKRAGAMTLMNLAVQHGMTAQQTLDQAKAMGYDCESEPAMKKLVTEYIERHSPAHRQ